MGKGLDALEHMNKNIILCEDIDEDVEIIKKELKALEIVKNKGVFVHLLRQSENVEVYNSFMIIAFKEMAKKDYEGVVRKFCLTQEEFDLLKEVLL